MMLERIRNKMYKVRGVDPSLRRRTRSSWPELENRAFGFATPSLKWIGGLVAALLAVAVVLGLLSSNNALRKPGLDTGPGVGASCLPPGTGHGAIGNITKYDVPGNLDNTGDITAGPDCSLWFIGQRGSARLVLKVRMSGEFTEYAIPNPLGDLGPLTTGPDGNIWFTESRGVPGVVSGARLTTEGRVSRLTASGTFAAYPIPLANTRPFGVATGPDGNIWFTDRGANQVVKVTRSGTLTGYPIPTRNSQPGAITAGPDGNVWFIEGNPGKVARVATSGSITEFAVSANTIPVSIASGPDGNLWMTERGYLGGGGPGAVAKVTTSGTFTEYSIPISTAAAQRFRPPVPSIITAGRDGNLWFLYGFAIVRLTPSGVFTEYPILTASAGGSVIHGIAAGPDGNIWFTENRQGQHQIGRLVAL